MWKRLSSKVLFKHPHLVVKEDEVQIRPGKRIRYLRYGYSGNGVVLVVRNNQDQVLFIREYSYVPDQRLLQLPMGKIETDESPKIAANRELQEETGLKANKLIIVGSYFQNHRRSKNKGYVTLATDLFSARLDSDQEEQDIELVWVFVKDIAELISKGEIVDADTLSSLRICEL